MSTDAECNSRSHLRFSERVAVITATTALIGWLIWGCGASIVLASASPKVRDTVSAIGASMMSVASLLCIVVVIAIAVEVIRNRTFRITEGIIVTGAMFGMLIDAVITAHW